MRWDEYFRKRSSELNLNQYSVDSICTVCGSPPCPDLNLIHYSTDSTARRANAVVSFSIHYKNFR
ncbi:hypothetical protein ELB75_08495 [Eikenella corrodens]|uniref:Uncharacterized protein n=1 Tax=Eikenella corrodens TaxID=539 RepID=A0A3S9SKP5_EIKCO|nr:hypothetical protein ELB75_08495 [Eikenella corrodens]